ncbi:hypothetical protein MNBD_GAMMA01-2071 [hydrothermal vent metagenome]|uniref:Glycosyltransferase RgtA/B/C/D-like domain-containing protein n=1 Tax=hydrothermal vent metagenome TaxID=652676 RepID=A0A3B0VT01_9ZZZZ
MLAGIVLINSIAYIGGVVSMDSARDIQRALEIANGLSFPLAGPDIGGFLHAGPLWFYFLAIPTLTGSLIFISLWIGFFASLKFVFAYLLGKELIDKKFGALWSIYLLLPGWKTMDQFAIGHTNVVETLCLLFLLLLLRYYKTGSEKYLLLSVFALSVAIHGHPSTLILGILFIPSLFKHFRKLNLKIIVFSIILKFPEN